MLRSPRMLATRDDVMLQPYSFGRKHTFSSSACPKLHRMQTGLARNMFNSFRSDVLRSIDQETVLYES